MTTSNVLINGEDATSNILSPRLDLGDMHMYSVHVQFTGSDLAGTLKLQASNDTDEATADWVDVSGSSQSVSSAESHIWNNVDAAYRYARVSWEYTSGTGNITAVSVLKENTFKRV